jgi:hypothetical protein
MPGKQAVIRRYSNLNVIFVNPRLLEHDPEKWAPVFGKDHAPRIS